MNILGTMGPICVSFFDSVCLCSSLFKSKVASLEGVSSRKDS